MRQTLAYRKTELLKLINSWQQEAWIQQLESFIKNLLEQNKAFLYAKPLLNRLDQALLIQKQGYQTANIVGLFGLLSTVEPFEDLLNDLSR